MSESWTREDWEKALEKVAGHLESLEDTIIFYILERAQYKANDAAYEKGKSGYEGHDDESLLDLRLRKHEEIDAEAGRYEMPEEVPFTKCLHGPERKFERSKADRISGVVLEEGNRVDLSEDIFENYVGYVGLICRPGDDKQYGSATEKDILALRALGERIHYGAMYVAECKFNMDPEGYSELIRKKDWNGLKARLTRTKKEDEILERVRQKVIDFQKDARLEVRELVKPNVIVEFFRDVIIPLTKKGEVQYLLQKKV